MTYTVHAKRWTHGWELHIEGVGVTQSRTLDTAERQARDYIESLLDIADADVTVIPELGDLSERVRQARAAVVEARKAEADAARESRATARGLRAEGLSVSDAAYVMGVSRGRISQLVK